LCWVVNMLIKKPIIVKTEAGDIHGILRGYDRSTHNGIGALILESCIIIRSWVCICIDSEG
jgi:small nuclear ribonucleoprotein (snRNP)-like protein